VLSAAHCIDNYINSHLFSAENLLISLGMYNRHTEVQPDNRQYRKVMIFHALSLNFSTPDNFIGLNMKNTFVLGKISRSIALSLIESILIKKHKY
jgi:hypothetical protein